MINIKGIHYELIGTGLGIVDFDVSGEIKVIDKEITSPSECFNKVLLVNNPPPSIALLMRDAIAVLSIHGGLTCHVAAIGRELGVPVLTGAKIDKMLNDGLYVHLICKNSKGKIYEANFLQEC